MKTIKALLICAGLSIISANSMQAGIRVCTGKSAAAIKQECSKSRTILETIIVLHHCNQDLMLATATIKLFLSTTCHELGTQPLGTPLIVHTGDDANVAGFRFVQITKQGGCITGSCINNAEKLCIRILTHDAHNPEDLAQLAQNTFEADSYDTHSVLLS